MGDGRRQCDGQRFNTIGRAKDDPCSRAPRRKALEVPSIYASRFTREREPQPDTSTIKPFWSSLKARTTRLWSHPQSRYGPVYGRSLPPLETFKLENQRYSPPLMTHGTPTLCILLYEGNSISDEEEPIVTSHRPSRRFFATKSAIMT